MEVGSVVAITEAASIYGHTDDRRVGIIVEPSCIFVGSLADDSADTVQMWKVFINGKIEAFYEEDLTLI